MEKLSITEAGALLKSPLPMKIPVSCYKYSTLCQKFTEDVVETVFELSPVAHAQNLLAEVYKVLYPPVYGKSENAYIALWDCTIRNPLCFVSGLLETERNMTSISTQVSTP